MEDLILKNPKKYTSTNSEVLDVMRQLEERLKSSEDLNALEQGYEAQLSSLSSKIRVLQEEKEKYCQELNTTKNLLQKKEEEYLKEIERYEAAELSFTRTEEELEKQDIAEIMLQAKKISREILHDAEDKAKIIQDSIEEEVSKKLGTAEKKLELLNSTGNEHWKRISLVRDNSVATLSSLLEKYDQLLDRMKKFQSE